MTAVVPRGAWHRFRSAGYGVVFSATIPGPHVEQDVDDPRPHLDKAARESQPANASPSIFDLPAEAAKLTMFRGLTPKTRFSDRKGSAVRLGDYRDGMLILGKSAGTSHWETHPADELVHVLDGTRVLEIVGEDGPPEAFELRGGMVAVVPRATWHRVRSVEGGTVMSATIPGEHIELDVDDPRAHLRQPA
jgi:quercetin dioxygenase-like cupin family protein